ncbi:group II intron maturase-specific domain-containing protein [Paenibacillus luteus]|uniref:group II intron maturase-specific domain-containing protein n=1 Tax=Paenibacillus luteus TaxID=2545753 RepID=UPI0011429EF4
MCNKSVSIEELAKLINPVIRGSFNYFLEICDRLCQKNPHLYKSHLSQITEI